MKPDELELGIEAELRWEPGIDDSGIILSAKR